MIRDAIGRTFAWMHHKRLLFQYGGCIERKGVLALLKDGTTIMLKGRPLADERQWPIAYGTHITSDNIRAVFDGTDLGY